MTDLRNKSYIVNRLRSAIVIAVIAQSAVVSAVEVTVTANFTSFEILQFYDAALTFRNQLSINGTPVSICNSITNCQELIDSGKPISFDIAGNSASFGYDPTRLQFTPRMNTFSFAPAAAQNVAGKGSNNIFNLGKIEFVNGQFFPLATVSFELKTHSTDADFDGHILKGSAKLQSVQTNPPYDSFLEADYFTLLDSEGQVLSGLGSVRVYDQFACPSDTLPNTACNIGTVDVLGYVNSLHISRFSNPTGGAFLNTSIEHIPSPIPEGTTVQYFCLH